MTGCGCDGAKCRLAAGDARHGSTNGYDHHKGRGGACVLARRESDARYRAANLEKMREKQRENSARYRAANPEKVRESKARYRAANPEKERKARYRAENAEKERERNARYRAENAEKIREYLARYRAENPEKVRESAARYLAANAEKVRESKARYAATPEGRAVQRASERRYRATPEGRAVQRAASERYRSRKLQVLCTCCATSDGYAFIWAMDSGRCAYCGDPATDIEHMIPLSKGGWDCVWNLRASCKRCNRHIKKAKPVSYLLDRLTALGIPIRPGATNSGLPCPAAAERMARRALTA